MNESKGRLAAGLLGLAACLVSGGFAGAAESAQEQATGRGAWHVEVHDGSWRDTQRQRDVSYKVYLPVSEPEDSSGPLPVILFSHGLGGTKDSAEYLGQFLASHGYACFHLQHAGTDESIWAQGMSLYYARLALKDWRSALDRFLDVPFAIDQISRLTVEEGPFEGRLDVERIGMSGHSYGAVSTLVAAGQRLGSKLSYREPRIRAGIAYSPSPPRREPDPAQTWADIDIPLLHFTGTEDRSAVRELGPSDRRIPFERISASDQLLVTLEGGDHMIFSGRARGGLQDQSSLENDRQRNHRHREIIKRVSLEFWNSFLRADEQALEWLFSDQLISYVARQAQVEIKRSATATGVAAETIEPIQQPMTGVVPSTENSTDHDHRD